MQRDDVRFGQQFIEFHPLQAKFSLKFRRQRDKWIVIESLGSERFEARSGLPADAAHAKISHRAAENLEWKRPQTVDVPAAPA